MIYPPEFPPHIDEPAERMVYNALKNLDPERYDVYYRRSFSGLMQGESKDYEVDFLIADLGGGRLNALLVLEVKGGIVKYDGVNSRWTQNGQVMSEDPVEQSKGNMHNLVKHYRNISSRVPFGWAVCFPDPRNTYSKKQVPPFIAPLQLIEPFVLGTIDKHLPQLFSFIRQQNTHLGGASMEQYWQLKASLLSGLGQAVPLHTRLHAEEKQLIWLTQEQMKLLDMINENKSLLITGPAGCGKTVMATTIANRAREEGLKVLMLTFNRIPAANIRLGFGLTGEEEDITIDNYHHFAHMQVDAVEPGWWLERVEGGDDFWQLESAIKLDEVLKNQSPQYDVLIIDEGQDFHLPHNCRNTIRIIELLEQYIDKKIPYREETPAGEPVRFYSYKNDIEQSRTVKEEWLRLVQQEQISPGRIVIIMSTHWEQSCLRNIKAFGQWPIEPISKETGYISPGHVNITTIRTFKDLEADVVFIIDTDKMEKHDKRVLYAQASRARLWLGVFEKKF